MKILSSNKDDINFIMNCLDLFINSLIESNASGNENTYPLNYIMKNTKISNIDWCSYLTKCLAKKNNLMIHPIQQEILVDHDLI